MGQALRLVHESRIPLEYEADLKFADLRLKMFAKNTGGLAFFPRFFREYPSIFKNISMYLRYQYTLAYEPENQKLDGKKRKIKVEAFCDLNDDGKPEKLKVRHKKSYKVEKKK